MKRRQGWHKYEFKYKGRWRTLADLAKQFGHKSSHIISVRMSSLGWSLHKALATPHYKQSKLKIPYCRRCKRIGYRTKPGCKECRDARVKLWHQTHRRRRRQHVNGYCQRNRERIRAKGREYWQRPENKIKGRQYNREWRKNNPRKRLAQHRRANAKRYYGPEFAEAFRQLRDLERQIAGKKKGWNGHVQTIKKAS